MIMVPVASSSDDNRQISIETQPQHVHSTHSDPSLREDSPGRIMRIVPSEADVSKFLFSGRIIKYNHFCIPQST